MAWIIYQQISLLWVFQVTAANKMLACVLSHPRSIRTRSQHFNLTQAVPRLEMGEKEFQWQRKLFIVLRGFTLALADRFLLLIAPCICGKSEYPCSCFLPSDCLTTILRMTSSPRVLALYSQTPFYWNIQWMHAANSFMRDNWSCSPVAQTLKPYSIIHCLALALL